MTIHVNVVTNLSAPLAALISNGVMKESTSKVAVLDDVEAETFKKFCSFAYTGGYLIYPNAVPGKANPETSAANGNTDTDCCRIDEEDSSYALGTKEMPDLLSTGKKVQIFKKLSYKDQSSKEFETFSWQLWHRFRTFMTYRL